MDIERLRALENKWREMANDRANAEWVTLVNCANDLRDLIAELGQEVGAVGDGTCYDRGPWRWERTGSKVDVFSDDFTCDVALRIDGDFATDDVADSYAKWLADTLNGHITSPAHTSEARDAARYRWIREKTTHEDWDGYSLPHVCDIDFKPGSQLNEMHETLDAAIDAAMRQEGGSDERS